MKAVLFVAALIATPSAVQACEGPVTVCETRTDGDFVLIDHGVPATVYVNANAPKPVLRVAQDFADDLERVSGKRPEVVHAMADIHGPAIVITVGGLDTAAALPPVQGWEAYGQSVVLLPSGPALVISGADPRGAVFGTYDLSAKMGVSPWCWWADVPVAHKDNLYVTAGSREDAPKVKYRGFFINDEEPGFGGWAREKFGGINHLAYEKVFELELRLKGNYLWPAMWGKSIADDDPQTLDTASDYGIVLGTSHHEPMTRAQEEWHRHTDEGVTGGKWDYTKNADNLRKFWRGGIERMVAGNHENVVTVGMRGDGDEPMSEGTATALLEQIVADQREIIADVTKKPADQTPQVWALYKEVQDYYDHGMTVPDDVTLLFADDNWGQIRRLPVPCSQPTARRAPGSTPAPPCGAKQRAGGYGVYYHFDYVGGPRNYKWLNTNQIEKVWQQMDLAWETGVDRLWIVNVGDIKPMEYPLSFFMDMAWNPDAMTPEALKAYPAKWAGQQFGQEHASEIGRVLTRYSQFNARRKPELLDASSFDSEEYSHLELDYRHLAGAVGTMKLPSSDYEGAFFQLVDYPVEASHNLYMLYVAAQQNRILAAKSDPAANRAADTVEELFRRDRSLAAIYHGIEDGKWNHMMDQTHIGYDNWQQPDVQKLPPLTRVAAKTLKEGVTPGETERSRITIASPQDRTFDEVNGAVTIEAEHYARKFDGEDVSWLTIPDLGRTLSSVISYPQAAPSTTVADGMRLEYDIKLSKTADATLNLYLAPTLDTRGAGGLRLAVAIDDGAAQTLTYDLKPMTPEWDKAVSDNIVVVKAAFPGLKAGKHTIKVYRIDGNVVLERLVLDTGGMLPSYLGPPESPTAP